MRTVVALCLLTPCLAMAQGDGVKSSLSKAKPHASTKVSGTSLVSQAEARAVILRVQKALGPVVKASYGAPAVPSGTTPVTRSEVVAEFSRIFISTKPHFKFTPRKQQFERSRITLKDAKQRPNLEKLITYGAVARLGPIAAGSRETLSVSEFGDAVGLFMARMADLTHLPSSKWTPGLQPQ